MTVEDIEKEFELLQSDVREIKEEVERDAHMDFINSLKQYVNKY